MKKSIAFFLVCVMLGFSLVTCEVDKPVRNVSLSGDFFADNLMDAPYADNTPGSDNIPGNDIIPGANNIPETDIIFETIVWYGDSDKAVAVNIEAALNTTRNNASGVKISSGAHSNDFPGIYFIWDSKQKDNGYLKVAGGVFALYESFVLTSKEANTYWDFLIATVENQETTNDGCYVFFIPRANNNNNINMVLLDRWTLKEIPVVPPEETPVEAVPIQMVWIESGTFIMGSPPNIPNTQTWSVPQHSVSVDGFYMGVYEVTQAQYTAVMGKNPSRFSSNPASGEIQENRPVETISWYDTLVFCNRLSMLNNLNPAYSINGSTNPDNWGAVPENNFAAAWDAVKIVPDSNGYRLPSEIQWEYACRAGTTTLFYTGDTVSNNACWYSINSNNMTHEVGLKKPNAWGLYDMNGNVQEWCWDLLWYYPGNDKYMQINKDRVMRGGNQSSSDNNLRSTYRSTGPAYIAYTGASAVGLRLARP